jgi:hypothetical protein
VTSGQANPLARLEAAHRMLAEARTVDEIKHVRDLGKAAALYARERQLGIESVQSAQEIVVRAERKAGELLTEMPKNNGTAGTLRGRDASGDAVLEAPENTTPTLADLGVTAKQSSQWQQVAAIPEPVFEEAVRELKMEESGVSSAKVLRIADQQRVAADIEAAEQVLETAREGNPEGRVRVDNARLLAAFSRALVQAQTLISLKPEAIALVLTPDRAADSLRFIRRMREWADSLEEQLAQPLRAVK